MQFGVKKSVKTRIFITLHLAPHKKCTLFPLLREHIMRVEVIK